MRIKRYLALLISTLPFLQCKTIEYTPSSFEGSSISFGSGGGMTGQVKSTTLLDNGQIFSGQGLGEMTYERIGKLSRNDCQQLFDNYETLKLSEIECDLPGNTYRFLEYKTGSDQHRIVWGNKKDLPDMKVDTFYQILKNKTQLK